MKTYPDQYLLVRECRSGQTWIAPLSDKVKLDLKELIKQWIKNEFCEELILDGEIQPRLEGDYWAEIKLNGESPDSVSCWDSGGFWLKGTD